MAQDKKKKAPAMRKAAKPKKTRASLTAGQRKTRRDREANRLQKQAQIAAQTAKRFESVEGGSRLRDQFREQTARLNAATRKARKGG